MAEPLPYKGGEPSVSVSPFPTRKKVVATASLVRAPRNRTGEPSEPFCGKGETPPHGVSFCKAKAMPYRGVSTRVYRTEVF
ncbi:MAG: hypothetical protein RR415_03155 [Ruthenibacterium sp.]